MQKYRPNVIARLMCWLLLLAACGDSNETPVAVDVRTGLVPGPEFSVLVVEAFRPTGTTAFDRIALVETPAVFGDDFEAGRRGAELELPRGEFRLRARLLRADRTLLVERSVLVVVSDQPSAVTIPLTRDCVGVACPSPGGSAALSECLGGSCEDPRCTEEDRTFCSTVIFCNAPEDCEPVVPCARQTCNVGLCEPLAVDGACPEGSWCDPARGCTLLQGIGDGGVTSDGGILCGGFCVAEDAPCFFASWDCSGDLPVCEALMTLPLGEGVACGAGRSCSADGMCR